MKFLPFFLSALLLLSYVSGGWSAAAGGVVDLSPLVAIDFGNEWSKVCLANHHKSSIGTFLDVVINEQSNRKSPTLLGFDMEDDLQLGENAVSLLFRSPARVFPHVKRLLGKKIDSEDVKLYQQHFPALELIPSDRNTVVFKKKGGDVSVEEVVVLLFQALKKTTENHIAAAAAAGAKPKLSGAVLTVPESFSKEQRELLQALAKLAGLNPKSVVNELTAVAVDFGVRNLQEGASAKYAFFGGGANGVSAILTQLSRKDKELRVEVLKSSFSTKLGGYNLDILLRDYLAKKFDDLHQKGGKSVTTNPRAMAKLLRESRELKEQLSVSPVLQVVMEELFNGKDFQTSVKKEEFENLLAPLISDFIAPLLEVVKGEEDVKGIELFGGVIRIPAIQKAISSALSSIPLGKHVDGEEAVILGSAHYAGVLDNINGLLKVTIDESKVIPVSSDVAVLSDAQFSTLSEKMGQWEAAAEKKRLLDTARNQLESLVNRAREVLSDNKKNKKSKKAAYDGLEETIASVATFIEDASKKTPIEEFQENTKKLQNAIDQLKGKTGKKKDDL